MTMSQLDWIKDPEKGWEKWRNYDNLPEGYKSILKREDKFRVDSSELTDGVPYTYQVSYWSTSDTYSVIRWPKKPGFSAGGSSWRKPPNEYSFTKVEEGNQADINEIAAMGRSTGEKWKYEGFAVIDGKIIHIITRQDKLTTDQNQNQNQRS